MMQEIISMISWVMPMIDSPSDDCLQRPIMMLSVSYLVILRCSPRKEHPLSIFVTSKSIEVQLNFNLKMALKGAICPPSPVMNNRPLGILIFENLPNIPTIKAQGPVTVNKPVISRTYIVAHKRPLCAAQISVDGVNPH